MLGGLWWVAVSLAALRSPDLAVKADATTYSLHAACYALCALMPFASTCAHLFYCQGPQWCRRVWSFDHVG